ncbi:MAG: PQQ-binding-like beta-propeller repeat protein [Gammaproteobacteria bacterium]|nr:PQQ-binding-like beta-propeller repeat protein [Gammaproteobacteria bacterium]MDD9896971.1 PQQ-binding-like beta-propeller repeat protein [Gammaproteobacteria bacterium]MDD9958440.1 PQQ-binding-like beta-propeller repeat protein [Gammaproteobacteria bacterium]
MSKTNSKLAKTIIAGAGTVLVHATLLAQENVSYTEAQAEAGQQTYEQRCASCHGYNLEGFELAPSLSGNLFSRRFGDSSADNLALNVLRMPPNEIGLSEEETANVLAYLFSRNGIEVGATPVSADLATLANFVIPAQELVDQRFAPRLPSYSTNGPVFPLSRLDELTPVSNDMLMNPPADDWLVWRRTHSNLGHSPLSDINKANVDNLRVEWTWSLPPGANMMTPIVHDGVMFTLSTGDVVQALDATTGDLLWAYQHQLPEDVNSESKKGVAIWEDQIIVATSDLKLIAIDAKSGRLVWEHAIETYGEVDHRFKSAPMIVNDKAIFGLVGQMAVAGGNFIVAIDLNERREAWRFYTIARPDEPYGNSWNGLSLEERTGGSVWTPGSYDPETNLVYFGPAPTYDTVTMREFRNVPGTTSDALYTNSTIALDADTGELVWHFQHVRNDLLDLDWAFERQIMELPVNGVMRKAVVTGGKAAIFEAMDAATGEYLFSIDMDMQNVFSEIDPRNGDKTMFPEAVLQPGEPTPGLAKNGVCPDALGARNMQTTSYNPATNMLYIPMQDTCINNLTGRRWQKYPDAEQEGLWGLVKAVDLSTREVMWTTRQFGPPASGHLTTDTGLLFRGTIDRLFQAVDQDNGDVLWEQRLDNSPTSYPITYRVDGKQYVAVATNAGSYFANGMERTTGIINPPSGASLWVFGLPD